MKTKIFFNKQVPGIDPTAFHSSKGSPQPLGVSVGTEGTNFALYASPAKELRLCFFLPNSSSSIAEIPLLHKTGDIWHICFPKLPHNLLYAYRIKHAGEEELSHYLLDPYAKHVFTEDHTYRPLGHVDPHSSFDWEDISAPNIPLEQLIIYEAHLGGFTKDPSSTVNHPGTFLGLIEKIPYLVSLGINALELLPICEFNEGGYRGNSDRLCNFWGYSPVNLFSPMRHYGTAKECKTLIKELHKQGIECILDIVVNHTNEGNCQFSSLSSYGGIAKQTYYQTDACGKLLDFTGCGNTMNCNHPVTMQLLLDALRYWVIDIHVDGFRFDLASILMRGEGGMPLENPPILEAISKDPLLAQTKLIAEPWDAAGLYHVGGFYPQATRWSEWNGRFRDTARQFIKGDERRKEEAAGRLCGSQDLYHSRMPATSINFITAHDGFTLADLVSYNEKHNEANEEENRDGSNCNDSWNCGVEGETEEASILLLRERQKKNLLLFLLLARGVPMLSMGDEYGHTKKGNNNSWCQDNEYSWFLWKKAEENKAFTAFVSGLIHFRKKHRLLWENRFPNEEDVIWHGQKPCKPEWEKDTRLLAFTVKDHEKEEDLYASFNCSEKEVALSVPPPPKGKQWHWVANSSAPAPLDFIKKTEEHPLLSREIPLPSFSSFLLKAQS